MECFAKCFPKKIHREVDCISQKVDVVNPAVYGPTAVICKETIKIPYRTYLLSETIPPVAHSIENTILLCLYSRHSNGYIREDSVDRLFSAVCNNTFVLPYLLKAAEEYVLSIVNLILSKIELISEEKFEHFFDENPQWLELMRARSASYWNCYYRRDYPKYPDYPGAKIVSYLTKFAG